MPYRRRYRRRLEASPFSTVSPRQWQHHSAAKALDLTTTGTKSLFEVSSPSTEVTLYKDIHLNIAFWVNSTGTARMQGRLFWYNIPRQTTIEAATIDKKDTKRIWHMTPVAFIGRNYAQTLHRSFSWPKKQVSEDDRFGLALLVDAESGTTSVVLSGSFLRAEYGSGS